MNTEFIFAKEEDLPLIVATYNETVAGRMVTADTEPVSVEEKKNGFTNTMKWIVLCGS